MTNDSSGTLPVPAASDSNWLRPSPSSRKFGNRLRQEQRLQLTKAKGR